MSHRNTFSLWSGARTFAVPFEVRLSRIHDRRNEIGFAMLVLFTLAVSVHDAALVVLNNDVIYAVEQNPIGCWLIEINGGSVWLFVGAKLVGTALCGAILLTLHELWSRVARVAALGVACFQFGLLIYLSTR